MLCLACLHATMHCLSVRASDISSSASLSLHIRSGEKTMEQSFGCWHPCLSCLMIPSGGAAFEGTYSMRNKLMHQNHLSYGCIFWGRHPRDTSRSTTSASDAFCDAMPQPLKAPSSDIALDSAGAAQRAMLPALSGIEAQLMEIACLGTAPG